MDTASVTSPSACSFAAFCACMGDATKVSSCSFPAFCLSRSTAETTVDQGMQDAVISSAMHALSVRLYSFGFFLMSSSSSCLVVDCT